MPIPRCDEAVGNTFGMSQFHWLMDAISGYNQIRVAGPGCTKYTWLVMPFDPINGPVIFIVLIHDMNSTWQELARTCGISSMLTLAQKLLLMMSSAGQRLGRTL